MTTVWYVGYGGRLAHLPRFDHEGPVNYKTKSACGVTALSSAEATARKSKCGRCLAMLEKRSC